MPENTEMMIILPAVQEALRSNAPVLALESAVITHGLPQPTNLELALELEQIARQENVTPATIALLNGKVHIGLTSAELELLAAINETHKISSKDISVAIQKGWSGGTTVAATLVLANQAGISVFATGGIGGVHRNSTFDISNDLLELSQNPLVVVASGAKSILDIPATLEVLETMGVPILGFQTDTFPEFYTSGSLVGNLIRVDSADEIARVYTIQKKIGLQKAILVANPIPNQNAISKARVDQMITEALAFAEQEKVSGAQITPYLLSKVSEISDGQTLSANLALLRNNVKVASQIAREIASQMNTRRVNV